MNTLNSIHKIYTLCAFLVLFLSSVPIHLLAQQHHTIEGKLQIGDDETIPTEGTIRYNDERKDFEGWTGSEWKSLTFSNADIASAFNVPGASTFSYIGTDTDMSWNLGVAGSLADNVQVFAVHDGCWGWQYEIARGDFPSSNSSSQFGMALDLFGGYTSEILAVSEPLNDHYGTDAGMVGVYRLDKNFATYRYHIKPADLSASDAFGRSISASGLYMAISSPFDDDLYSNSGSVYIYRDNVTGAALEQKIVSPQSETNGNFGHQVLMSGYDLFIYARGEGGWTLNGRVYHYVYQPFSGIYTLQQTIGNPEPGSYRYFGNTMAVADDHLMIGTAQSVVDSYNGTVLYYQRDPNTNTWNYTQKLTVPYNSDNDGFGKGIAMDADRMVVSAPGYDAKGVNTGSLFVFERDDDTWNQTKTLTISDSYPNSYTGSNLSTHFLWNNSILVGSPSWNASTGTVHFLKVK